MLLTDQCNYIIYNFINLSPTNVLLSYSFSVEFSSCFVPILHQSITVSEMYSYNSVRAGFHLSITCLTIFESEGIR